jgi:NADH-quinone oxidoreductase subunit M
MLLAGVVMKLGAYGALRVAMPLFPEGLAAWRDPLALLAVIGIVAGSGIALVQKDFKFVIGYSSVSHMGFVLLGLMTLSVTGLSGAVLQMFSHGIIASLLFAVVGRMVYDRVHTRELSALEALQLSKTLPFAATTFVLASVASMGLPGFSGFVAELQVLMGAWTTFPLYAGLAGVGILIGVAYTLRVLVRAFFSQPTLVPTTADAHTDPYPGISFPERLGAVMLLCITLLIGVYPRLLLDLILPSFDTPLMKPLLKGAGL